MTAPPSCHIPVLAEPIGNFFSLDTMKWMVDCTVGLGGHARLLLEANPRLNLIGLDADQDNLTIAEDRLAPFSDRLHLINANFADLDRILATQGVDRVDAILADLGLSSNQLADPVRGFSFERDGPLDMRLDRSQTTTAADLVNGLGEGELADLLYVQSQEPRCRRIAKRICLVRRQGRINSTVELARLVAAAVGENMETHRRRIHPATRTFMALRMSVNHEMDSLQRLLSRAPALLREHGRVAIISFHSVEDRQVKVDFRTRSREGIYRILTKKPIIVDEGERNNNPRSRSAKLRVSERRLGT